MKKNILFLFFLGLSGAVLAQEVKTEEIKSKTEAQIELNSYMKNGLVYFQTPDKLASFRVGGRVTFDGGYYIDQYTDRSSGVQFSEARLRVFSTFGRRLDMKFDVDFASDKVALRDVYLRWHTNKTGFVRVGNFAEPFSAENMQSGMDSRFITKSAMADVLGTGRTLGVSYRHYSKYLWAEGGVFSQKLGTNFSNGDMGYGASARVLGRYQSEEFNVHVGGSVSYRRPDANGFTNGSDDFNRQVKLNSSLESSIDRTPFLEANLNNVQSGFKFGLEAMATYRNFYVAGEYIKATYTRERDWEYSFISSMGSVISTMTPTLDSYKSLFGPDTKYSAKGFNVQAGCVLTGSSYQYSNVDGFINRVSPNSLELVARFSHLDLNHVGNGIYDPVKNQFFASTLHSSFGLANDNVPGGKADVFTVGLNYYFPHNIIARVNYSYQMLTHDYTLKYKLDRDMHAIQARLTFEF